MTLCYHYEDRLAQLNAVDSRLTFGRLDMDREGADAVRYIGRIGITDSNQQRLLMDWRPRGGYVLSGDRFPLDGGAAAVTDA